jgi:Tfp pilus assembly protein PilX
MTMEPLRQATGAGGDPRRGERGSALVIATLVSVILSLLGISYMMMAQTENTIAENERNAMLALYVAEAGGRLAVNWFNDPSSTGYLVPTSGQVDRTRRIFDHDNNTGTARVQGSAGNAAQPIYKDANFTSSPILDRPYRSALAETFLGIQTGTDPNPAFADMGPDIIVSDAHLQTINDALFPNFPSVNLRARITRIEIYAPPSANIGGVATRLGVATVRVTGGVFMYPGTASERQIATRVVKVVVNEIPVPGPVGPLQSCSTLNYGGNFEVHWGTGSSQAAASLPTSMNAAINSGLPYAPNDPFTYITGATTLASWATAKNGQTIEDPWFKFIAGGPLTGGYNPSMVNAADPQPWPWNSGAAIGDDHSNLFQNTIISCPTFDYNLWKSIAQSGNKGHYYYKWVANDTYQLDGVGSAVTFANATSGRTGVFFFDTADASLPRGLYTQAIGTGAGTTNLTPNISIPSAAGWQGVFGFVYLNSKTWGTTGTGATGSTRTIFPPGEPSDGSGFVNIDYPTGFGTNYVISQAAAVPETFTDATGTYCVDYTTCPTTPSATPVLDPVGLPFQATVVLDGVMYNSGTFTAQGNANFFGSLVANQGVLDGAGTPRFWFDESLIKGNWPRKGMNLPRVVVTVWETEL